MIKHKDFVAKTSRKLYDIRMDIIDEIIEVLEDNNIGKADIDTLCNVNCGAGYVEANLVEIAYDSFIILVDNEGYTYSIGDVVSCDELLNIYSDLVYSIESKDE